MASYARRQAGRAGRARHPSVGLGRSPEGCRPAGQQEQARRHPGAKDDPEGGDGTLAPVAPCPRHQAGHRQQCERRFDQRESQQDAGRIEGETKRRVKGRSAAGRPLLLLQQEPRSRQSDEDDTGKLAKRQVEQAGREEDGGHDCRQRAAAGSVKSRRGSGCSGACRICRIGRAIRARGWGKVGPGSRRGGAPAEPRTSHHRALRQQQPEGSRQGEGE